MRADIQHEVSHDAKNSHFYHVFSTYEDGRRQARANRGVCPYIGEFVFAIRLRGGIRPRGAIQFVFRDSSSEFVFGIRLRLRVEMSYPHSGLNVYIYLENQNPQKS